MVTEIIYNALMISSRQRGVVCKLLPDQNASLDVTMQALLKYEGIQHKLCALGLCMPF